MNNHTLKILEFDKIKYLIKDKCSTEIGINKSEEIKPLHSLESVREKLKETEEAVSIIDREGSFPFGQIYDIRDMLSVAGVGQTLNEQNLLKCSAVFRSLDKLFIFLRGQEKETRLLLAGKIRNFPDFDEIYNEIDKKINYDGYVNDNASANLSLIRNELKISEQRLKEKINHLAVSPKYKTYLSDSLVTVRNDRYCLPVKAEYKSQIPGIVHDSSGSGQTLFIEPGVIVDMGNKIKDLKGREKEEIYRVLASLSQLVGSYSESGKRAIEAAGEIDLINARATLSYDLKCVKPKINDKGYINLIEARHPLLYLQNSDCVPIDVSLGKNYTCMLITGPNTGGKTVMLKTVGLISVMAMCGMFVPCASDTEICVFKDIWTDIGDEQSIEQSLSTFSAHLKNIVEICDNAGKNSLVLLDEPGAGTDPAEGAALARGIIEDLCEKESVIIATTHYGELKNFAYVRENIINASVEFDNNTLKPTYRLLTGVPGFSNAFYIAERMGINKNILQKCNIYLNREKDEAHEIIEKIEEVHREAGRDRIEAAKRLKEIEEIKNNYSEKLRVLEQREGVIEDKIRKRANKIIKQYTDKIGETLDALKKTESENSERQNLKKELNRLVDDFRFDISKKQKSEMKTDDREPLDEVIPGERVWIRSLGMTGNIEEYKSDNKIIVMVGSMKMTMPKSNLAKAKEEPEKRKSFSIDLSLDKSKSFRSELKLLGMRAEEAVLMLDKFIDDAVAAGAESFRVVHGKGTGALRSAVHLFLKESPYVKSYELCDPGEGGDGATKVYL